MEPLGTPVITSVQSLNEPFIKPFCCLKIRTHLILPIASYNLSCQKPLRGPSVLHSFFSFSISIIIFVFFYHFQERILSAMVSPKAI